MGRIGRKMLARLATLLGLALVLLTYGEFRRTPIFVGDECVSSDSLIAPADLLRFAAVYAAFIVLPGHVVATAANRRSARLARIMLAIPCSYSLVTVYGLISVLLHIPFTASAY